MASSSDNLALACKAMHARLTPSSIPHLCLPMVQSNVRLGSQLMGEDTVEFANSLGKAHRVEIVVESKQVFTFVESLVTCLLRGRNAEQG